MRPNLLKVNPNTGQSYTPAELAEIDLQKRDAAISGTPFGGLESVTAGSVREIVPDATNDYFEYSKSGFIVGNDNDETRAQLQPWTEQLGNAAIKMGTTAGATFFDGTAGFVGGLINMAANGREQGVYNAFINNPISNAVLDFQDSLEKALPNYRTKQEQENNFLENAFSATGAANFWGDTILKNLGFAIGAVATGAVTGGIGAEALGINKLMNTSKILEGLAVAAKEGKVLSQAEVAAAKALTSETLAGLDSGKVISELEGVAKTLKAKTAQNQLISSIIGSVGESRLEALGNSREFVNQKTAEYDAALQEGTITQAEYNEKMKNLDKETLNYQNSLFTANMALLSISNYAQFKNVFSKGFTENTIARNAVNEVEQEGLSLYEVAKRSKFKKALDAAALIKNPLMEMTEEQGQYVLQKAADSYYSMKTDREANATVKNWIFSLGQGLREAYGTNEGWENAFAGLVIGALGVPVIKKNAKGKYGLTIAGGVAEDYQEAKANRQRLELGVQTANELIKNSMTKKLYDSSVVDIALEKKFDQSVQENDRLNGKLIAGMQLANMVDAFVSIGRYDDLITRLQDETKLSASELRAKYKTKAANVITGKEKEVDFFNNMTDDQVVQYIKDKSETAIARAEKVKKLRESIDVRFANHSDDAKKDLLLKGAAVIDMDERIEKLFNEVKAHTADNFYRGLQNLKKNMDPASFNAAMINMAGSDFSDFATPVDLEQFLKKKNGLANYERLVKEYVDYQTDAEKKITFAEKARDLYGLIAKRQGFNDLYFALSDENYARNVDAANESLRNEEELAARASNERRYRLYKDNTSDDKEFGFDSTEFQVNVGTKKRGFVEGTKTKQDGTKENVEKMEYVRKDDEVRTSSTGDKYQTYYVLDENGKEKKVDVPNPVDTEIAEPDIVKLKYKKGDANNLHDEEGNAYSLDDLAKDPTFLRSKTVSIGEQRQEIINGVRKQTLQQLFNNNAAIIRSAKAQTEIVQQAIDETKALIEKARKNKTGKTRVTINGKTTTYTIFKLENILRQQEEELANINALSDKAGEENREAIYKMRQAEAKQFSRGQFAEDIAALEQQVKDIEQALTIATGKTQSLSNLISRLKNLVKVVYPKFKKAYREMYGVDPSDEDFKFVSENLQTYGTLWYASRMAPVLEKLKAEESKRLENIQAKEEELADLEGTIDELQKYLSATKEYINKIQKEQQTFEAALAQVLAARRASQSEAAKKAEAASKKASAPESAKIEEELTEEEAPKKREKFSFRSALKSIKNIFSTTGLHFTKSGVINPDKAQQRWYRTAAKLSLDKGEFVLRVITNKEGNEKIFENTPEELKDGAIAVVLYKDGKPVNEDFQPIELTDVNRLVYTFLPLPKLESTDFGQRYFDADEDAGATQVILENYTAFREELLKRGAEDKKGTFLRITGRSLGILNTTGFNRKDPNNDLTNAVYNQLFQGSESEKAQQFKNSRIIVAKSATPEQQEAGIATITVGGKEVTVANGLPYIVTDKGTVVPLLGRKVTDDEVDTIFNLLKTATTQDTIITNEGLEEEKPEEEKDKDKKDKGKFIVIYTQDKNKIAEGKKKGQFKNVKFNKQKKKWGYYATTQKAKKIHGADKKSIDIFNYIGNIIRFGRQTKADGSLLIANPNAQTEIYVEKGALTYYDFDKNTTVTIPFTKEGIETNEESLRKFLANKYHQVSNNLLNGTKSAGEFVHIEEVLYNAEGVPYVDTTRYGSYKAYLLSDKKGTNSRSTADIPLTTNVIADSEDAPMVRSVYFTFSDKVEDIMDSPTGLKRDKPTTAAVTDESVIKGDAVIKEVDTAIASNQFDDSTIEKAVQKLIDLGYKSEFEKFDETRLDALKDATIAASLDENSLSNYETLLAVKEILKDARAKKVASTEAPEIGTEEEEGFGVSMDAEALSLVSTITSATGAEDTGEDIEEEGFSENEDDKDDDEGAPGPFRAAQTGGVTINIEEAKTTLNRMLPQVPVKIREKLINGIAQGKVDVHGVLHLSNLAEEGSEYHEALHSLMLGILTDAELKEVYGEAKRLYGTPSESELNNLRKIYPNASEQALQYIYLDEKLAEDFRTYGLSGGKITPSKKMKGFFERIWDSIKAVLGLIETNAIDSMFAKLYAGEYANATYDTMKVKERIQANQRYKVLPFTNDPLKNIQRTKEVVDGVVHFLFKELIGKNTSVKDLAGITKDSFDKLLSTSMDKVKAGVLAAGKSENADVQKARATLVNLLSKESDRNLIATAAKDYIQRNLGIDLKLDFTELEEQNEFSGKENAVSDDRKETNDAPANKDATTISPKDNANAFVKLMISSLQETDLKDGVFRRAEGDIYGLPKLVDPNKAFNNILKYLHTSTTLKEMIGKLNQLKKNFPYMGDLAARLEDALNKGGSSDIQLAVSFQQAMYKANINFRTWLVNEKDVVDANPNSERQELRIMENWRQLLIDSIGTPGSFIEKNKGTKGLARFIKTKVADVLNTINKKRGGGVSDTAFEYYMEAMNALGFPMTNINYSNAEKELFMENAKYILATLSNTKTGKADLFVEKFFNDNKGRLTILATLEAARNGEVTDMQHIRADGKSIYGIIEHNMISQISEFINNMPVGTPIEEFFAKFPQLDNTYTRTSHLLKNVLFSSDGFGTALVRTELPFKISIIEAARINKPGEEGEVNTKLDKADRTWIAINSVLSNLFPIIRTSDKGLEYGIETSTGIDVENINGSTSRILDIFKGYLADELAVGQDASADDIQYFKDNKNKGVSPGVYFFQDILKDKVRPITEGEDINDYINSNKAAIERAISDFLVSEQSEIETRLLESGILEEITPGKFNFFALNLATKEKLEIGDTTKVNSAELDTILRTVTVNSLISNIEQTKLFFGHPAFYKNITDLLKRTAGAVGTKSVALVDDYINAFLNSDKFVKSRGDNKETYDGTFKTIVMKEPKGTASGLNQIRKMLVATYGTKLGNQFADSYEEYEEADGQGYITLPEYREMLFRLGEWSPYHEAIYQKAMRGEKLSPKEIKTYFNPVKAMYYGQHKMNTMSVPTYLKFSLMPLIPGIYKGTQIEDLAESLMNRAIGVMVYPSGAKVGALKQDDGNFVPLYNEENGLMTELSPDGEMPTMNLDYRFMGIQVQTGYDIHKKATVGTQHRKISIGNLFEGGEPIPLTFFDKNGKPNTSSSNTKTLVNEYNKSIDKITKILAKQVLDKIGATEISSGIYKINDFKKLADILRKAAYDKNQVDNIINSFVTVKDGDTVRFKYLLDAVPGRNKIENLLFSLINNTVLTQKYNGGSRIQAASTGFEKGAREFEGELLKSNPDLRFYTIGKHGETLPMQVKLVADENMQKLIDANGGREAVNAKLKELWALEYDAEGNVTGGTRYDAEKVAAIGLNPDIFQIIGFRIPTDSRATTESMEIAEFLDPLAGEAMHLPSELVVKSGGDYDIDKLTVYFNQLDASGHLITNETFEGQQNNIINLTKKIMTAPEIFSDMMAPVSAAKLKELADTVQSSQSVSSTKSLTMLYHLDQGEYYLVGKAGVGIIARHGTHHTLAQQSGLSVKQSYKDADGTNVSTKMNFEGLEDDFSLSKIWDKKGKGKGFKISQILSQFLQAFVDVAKDPFIFRMNGSTKTADIYAYMVRRGVPIESAAFFMNQPAIKTLYSRLAGAQALFKQGKKNSEGERLTDTYADIETELLKVLVNEAQKRGIELTKNTDIAFSEEDLKKHLKTDFNNIQSAPNSFLYTQYQVLKDFKRYKEQAGQLRELMDMTSDDTIRPKNFNALDTLKAKEVPAMFDEEAINNLYGNTFLKSFKEAHQLPEVYRELFLTEMNTVRSQFELLREYLMKNGVKTDDLNKLMDKLKNDFIVYTFAHHTNMNPKEVLQLFKGESTFAKRMMELIKNKKLSKDNPFIRNLYALLDNPKSLVDNLKMFTTKMNTYSHNELVAGFQALRSLPKGESLLYTAAVFAFVQSGLDNSPITWYDKVPVDIMNTLLKPGLEVVRGMSSSPAFELQQFFHQFIRNNFQSNNLVPTVGTYNPNGKGTIAIDNTGSANVSNKRYKNRMYVKVFAEYTYESPEKKKEAEDAGLPTGEYLLLMRVSGDRFQLVSRQGSTMYMKEYKRNIIDSSLTENNPDEGIFKSMFSRWSEPALATFQGKDTNDSIESIKGKKIKTEC